MRENEELIIRIMAKCDCHPTCESTDYFCFETKHFKFKFFDDYGHKFIYVQKGDKVIKRWDW